jgi:hypothetical protein
MKILLYHRQIDISAVICYGCHSTVRLGGYYQFCSMRKCALERGFDTRAECSGFACVEQQNFFVKVPQAKAKLGNLARIRQFCYNAKQFIRARSFEDSEGS